MKKIIQRGLRTFFFIEKKIKERNLSMYNRIQFRNSVQLCKLNKIYGKLFIR